MNKIVIPHLIGKKIDLCVVRTDEEAIQLYTKWMNDQNIAMWVHHNDCVDQLIDEKEWANRKSERFCNTWNIVDKFTGQLIGNCSCDGNRNVGLGICIGEPEGRNKGFGTEAIQLMVKFAFEEKNAHRVYLRVICDNIRAIECYKKIGFQIYGRERESGYYHGHYVDILEMDMLKREYFANYDLNRDSDIQILSKL